MRGLQQVGGERLEGMEGARGSYGRSPRLIIPRKQVPGT